MMIDYHVHTSLCNHATGTMEDYVRSAVAKGLQTICFLDHLTFQEGGRHNAMQPREVPMYVDAARRLARQYRETINVRVGLEVDFSPRHVDRAMDIVNTFDLDVVGSSIHFLDGQDVVSRRSAWARGERDADGIYAQYLNVLESMLDYDYFDVVCHLDLPKKYGVHPPPSAAVGLARLLEKVCEMNRVVEFNSSGWHCPVQEAFPSPVLLDHCSRLGIPVVFGSDAHAPDAVGRDFERARDLLCTAGYRHMTGFSHRRREMIVL